MSLTQQIKSASATHLSDLLTSARIAAEPKASAFSRQMFAGMFGALFCGERASYEDKAAAYEANKSRAAEVLPLVAQELEARFA